MSLLASRRLILAKQETTYGEDPDPPPSADDAILLRNLTLSPLDGGTVDRSFITPYLGASPKAQVNSHRRLEFEVEATGSGMRGTAPVWGALLKACASKETINSGVSAVYSPVSDGFDSIAIYHHLQGQLAKLLGARGTFTFSLTAQNLPVFKFAYTGLWRPTNQALQPAPVYAAQPLLQPASFANTPTFLLHGQAMVMKSIEINMGLQVVYRNLVGYEGVEITDRSVTATLTCEWPTVADLDVESLAKNDITGPLQLIHGTTAGNIVQIDAPKVQFLDPKQSEDQGIMMLQCTLLFQPDMGNDEIIFTSR
ncbi:MAG: phage tail tube protein [Magnetococcus sp. DMHC-8]